ncbi:phage tail assembly protein [Marinomonas aquiplantarum]|uniref:Tail assembly chaperone E/41/14-like protein n=1 Tax=Marinomonas aquiplantarum TaxID=491951 RepID=A0A366CXS9_9GAMM|nr:phage tail assembly protein [Marinomonas aquiplantarum]RBO82642.1 tail assembly chaperone E/41/14-like protein [Marinomonas aquiplantarum]
MFQPQKHTLVWPTKSDKGEPIAHVHYQPLTMGQHRTLSEQHKNNDTQLLRACISASTGLSETEIKSLVTPDYTSIQNQVLELMNATASQLIEGEFDSAAPTLLIPIQSDSGQQKTQYTLKPPTVATTDLMDTHANEWERTIFISSSCTGFSQSELERLSLSDWNQLQERLIDFLQQPAAYFHPKT